MKANLSKILEICHHIEYSEKVSSYHELFEQKLHHNQTNFENKTDSL